MNEDQATLDKVALKAVALQFLVNGAVISSIIPRLPEIRDALSVDLGSIGQVISMAGVGGIIGSLFSTWLLKRLGTKRTMIFGTLITIFILPLVAFASSIWSLFIVLAILMLLDPVIDIAMNMQGSNINARRDTPVMSRLHGLWSIGSVLGGLLAATMAMLAVPIVWHLLFASCLMLIALVFIGDGLLSSDDVVSSPKLDNKISDRKINMASKLWVFALLGATVFIPEIVASDWSPFRAKDDLNASLGVASMAYVAFTCGMVSGRMTGDYFVLKMGQEKQFKRAILISSIGMTIVCLIDSLAMLFIGLFISGLGLSVLFPLLYDMAAQDSQKPGIALSVMTAGSRLTMLIAPFSIGLLADTDGFNVGFSMAVFALPCLCITVFLMGPLIQKNLLRNHSINKV